jgi:PKHD-type hydroxylase
MFISEIKNILDAETVSKVFNIVREAKFVDGRISGGTERDKNNQELFPESEKYLDVLRIIELGVRENYEFNLTAFPRYMTRPIISRYEVGMFYKGHVDKPVMNFMDPKFGLMPLGSNYVRSDLSMTLFLSDPASYDGGELSFEAPFNSVKVKLDAGSAVVYPTGSRHQVLPVTRGSRYAAIFWIQTLFPVEAHRQAVSNAHQLTRLIKDLAPDDSKVNELAEENFFNLARMLAQV